MSNRVSDRVSRFFRSRRSIVFRVCAVGYARAKFAFRPKEKYLSDAFFIQSRLIIATWVSRFPSNESLSACEPSKSDASQALAPIQRDKFSHFFTYLLDHDRDGYVSRKDFSLLSEVTRVYVSRF